MKNVKWQLMIAVVGLTTGLLLGAAVKAQDLPAGNQPQNQQNQQNQPNQPNQNNQQNQPWADMCKDNTALACVDSTGKFIVSAAVGSDGKPVCPAESMAKCGNYQMNNQQNQPNNQPQNQPQNGQPKQMMGQNQGGPNQGQGFNPGSGVNGNGGGQGQMMGQNQQPNQGQQGPSEEEMAKQQEKRDAQQLTMMKKDVTKVTQGLKQPKALIVKAKKAGVAIPSELNDAISSVETYVNTVKNAKSMSEVNDLDTNPGDFFSEISDYMGFLSRKMEFPKMLTQAKKNFKTYQTAYTRLAKNKNIDTTDLKKAVDDTAAALAQVEADAKVATSSDSFDLVMDSLGEVYDVNFDNIRTEQQQAEFFVNYKKGLTNITSMIKKFATAIKRAQTKKLDADLIATAKEQSTQAQQLFDEVKAAASVKPVDIEDLMNKVSDLTDMINELGNTLDDLGVGVNNIAMPQLSQQSQQIQNSFKMPTSFNQPQQPQQMQQPQQPQVK